MAAGAIGKVFWGFALVLAQHERHRERSVAVYPQPKFYAQALSVV